MSNRIRLLIIAIIIGSSCPISNAQSELSEIKKLSIDADMIITGKVAQQNSSWNESKTRIFTKSTLQVEEYLKGGINKKIIEVYTPGGEVGEIGELYTHMPKFKKNEEVLLFLKKDSENSLYKVLNGEDGKIVVLNDDISKQKVTTSNTPINSIKEQIKSFLK